MISKWRIREGSSPSVMFYTVSVLSWKTEDYHELSQGSWQVGQNLNQSLLECNSKALPLKIGCLNVTIR